MTTEQTRPGQLVSEINTWTTSEGGKGGNGLRAMCVQMCITTDVVVVAVVLVVVVVVVEVVVSAQQQMAATLRCQELAFARKLSLSFPNWRSCRVIIRVCVESKGLA